MEPWGKNKDRMWDELYDLALNRWVYLGTRFDNDVYRRNGEGTGEVKLARYLLAESALDAFVGLNLIENRWVLGQPIPDPPTTDWGMILGFEVENGWHQGFWFVSNNGEVLIVPGSNTRKPVRVVPNAVSDENSGLG